MQILRCLPRGWGAIAAVFALLAFSGCYSTKFALDNGKPEKVDPAMVGDFSADGDSIHTRNIDGSHYYVEWHTSDKTVRMVGTIAGVRDTLFASLREMPEDGSISSDYLIMRVTPMADGSLKIQQLNDKFFAPTGPTTASDLADIIGANLDNPQMYDGAPVVARRLPPATQPAS